jgi:hypothetical protein
VIGWISWSGTSGASSYDVRYTPPCATAPALQCLPGNAWQQVNEWCEVVSTGTCAPGTYCTPTGCTPDSAAGTISVNPLAVRQRGTTTVTWSSTSAVSCTVEQQNAAGSPLTSWVGTSGSVSSLPVERPTIFSLQCTQSADPTLEFEVASTTLRIVPTLIET